MMRSAESEVMIVSPYFVPGERGLALMRAAIDNGIQRLGDDQLAGRHRRAAHLWRLRALPRPMLKLGVSLSELSPLPSRKFDMIGDLRSSLGRCTPRWR